MGVFEAVRTVLAVRDYQDRPVPDDVVRRIVEAGRLTGSSMNKQPWQFVVVRDRETLRRLGELARSGPYIADAPLGSPSPSRRPASSPSRTPAGRSSRWC